MKASYLHEMPMVTSPYVWGVVAAPYLFIQNNLELFIQNNLKLFIQRTYSFKRHVWGSQLHSKQARRSAAVYWICFAPVLPTFV